MYLFCVLKLISNMIQASHNANLKIGESFPWAGPGPRPLQKHAAGTLQPHPKHTSYWFRKPGKGARCICSMYWLDAFALWFNSWAEKYEQKKIMSRRHDNLRFNSWAEKNQWSEFGNRRFNSWAEKVKSLSPALCAESLYWICVLSLCTCYVCWLCVLARCICSMYLFCVLKLISNMIEEI